MLSSSVTQYCDVILYKKDKKDKRDKKDKKDKKDKSIICIKKYKYYIIH